MYIAVHQPSAIERAEKLGYTITGNIIHGCDSYKYKILPWKSGRSENFAAIALRVSNLATAKQYWTEVLGLEEFPQIEGLESEYPTAFLGFGSNQTVLQLIEVQDGSPVNHALSSGRIAFACPSVQPIFETVSASGDKVLVAPLTLPTPGKADVVVTILLDRDGYEICFVEDVAFYQLAEPKYDVIDFAFRASKGGDGNPLPKFEKEVHGEGHLIRDLQTVEEFERLAKANRKLLLIAFTASWCKKCKLIHPFLEAQAEARKEFISFLYVDIDEGEELAAQFGVSQVPHFILLDGQEYLSTSKKLLGTLIGNDEESLAALLDVKK